MKKLLSIVFLIVTGCAPSFHVKQLRSNEILGAGYEHLDGRLFSIFCAGDEFASSDFVKDSCLQNTAKFAYNKGYHYFTMISEKGDKNQYHSGGYISNGFYMPTETTTYSQSYVILLITKAETKKADNFYKVSDYYKPEK